jgi:hypothetical protein
VDSSGATNTRADTDSAASAGGMAANVSAPADASAEARPVDDEGLPGPPADSVVVAKQADLFARLRGGFQLPMSMNPP